LETTLALFTGYATFRPKNSGPPAEESATLVEATAVYRAAFEAAEEAGADDETAKQSAEQAVAEADTARSLGVRTAKIASVRTRPEQTAQRRRYCRQR
jgi:hypothetical protein